MLAGFCSAWFIGDFFLAVRAAPRDSTEFLIGVAGFGLAQILWTVGQLREARPSGRVFLTAALPLALFVLARLRPPVLPQTAQWAVGLYSLLTALSLATALATQRILYAAGIGLLLFSDLMIGYGFLRAPGCASLIGPTYIAAELCLLASFLWRGERRLPCDRVGTWLWALVGGVAAFACFTVAAVHYPGGGYNPLRQMLSALGRSQVRGVAYPVCHWWFAVGMFLSASTVAGVWTRLAHAARGWRRHAIGWGGALNAAGLCAIALVPENVNIDIHNLGCFIAIGGGVAILAARLRRGGDLAWTCWLLALVIFFAICLNVDAFSFDPWVTATQKALIVSFACWAEWLAWRGTRSATPSASPASPPTTSSSTHNLRTIQP